MTDAKESLHPVVKVPGLVVAYFGYYLGYVFAVIVAWDILEVALWGRTPKIAELVMYVIAFVLLQRLALHDRRDDD